MRFSSAAVRTAAQSTLFGRGARKAIVVGDGVAYGMARLFQSLRESAPDEVALFHDPAEARRWLGLRRSLDEDA